MGKEILIMIFGVWVAIQSFLGFPLSWDKIIFIILGLSILGLGALVRRDKVNSNPISHAKDTFAENTPEQISDDSGNIDESYESRT